MKFTTQQLIIGGVWLAFILLFWFLGASEHMTKATAFFGLAGLTAVYAGGVLIVKTILHK